MSGLEEKNQSPSRCNAFKIEHISVGWLQTFCRSDTHILKVKYGTCVWEDVLSY